MPHVLKQRVLFYRLRGASSSCGVSGFWLREETRIQSITAETWSIAISYLRVTCPRMDLLLAPMSLLLNPAHPVR